MRLVIEGGLHFSVVYFIERYRWCSSFLSCVFSTNSLFAFYSFQHNVHIRHRRDYVEQKAVGVIKHPMAYGGHFGRVFNRLATRPKPWKFTSRGGCRLYHKPFEHLNRLAVDHNNQTTRSTYPRTSTASGMNKNWLKSFLVTKSFQSNSLVRNK